MTPSTPKVLVIRAVPLPPGKCDTSQCCREFARGISEPEVQLEFLDDRQRRYETITLRVHARDHYPAAGRCRVDDIGDHALPSDRLEDHRAGRL